MDGGCSFTEPTAIMTGNVEGAEDVLCRVHDACYTSGADVCQCINMSIYVHTCVCVYTHAVCQ